MSFLPFDDSQASTLSSATPTQGYDTSGWDGFRQGIELTSYRYVYQSAGPKIWSGHIDGSTDFITYGQNYGPSEENKDGLGATFLDYGGLNPVTYVAMGLNYPGPLPTPEGTVQPEEAVLEPLWGGYRGILSGQVPFLSAVAGELDNAGNVDVIWGLQPARFSSILEQFTELSLPITKKWFQDNNGFDFGPMHVTVQLQDIQRKVTPFDDTLSLLIDLELQSTNSTFHSILRGSSQVLQRNNILPYGKSSMPAGFACYGLNARQYGTDSVTHLGWAHGS